MDVLVCVITFRRVDQLRRLLEALSRQRGDLVSFSVLVVDNDPEGSAAELCDQADKEWPVSIRYCLESEAGIVAARNRCVSQFLEGKEEALAFIDDDEWPDGDDWLSAMANAMREHDADIVAGDVLSVAAPGTPDWATRILYEPSAREEGAVVDLFYTGNVLIRRHVLERLAPAFDRRFALTGASDYHFALRCGRAGYRAIFADAPVLEEFPADRATVSWFTRRGFRSGAGYTRSQLLEGSAIKVVPKCLALAALRAGRGMLTLLRGAVTFDKVFLVKGLFRLGAGAGTLTGLVGITYREYERLHQ